MTTQTFGTPGLPEFMAAYARLLTEAAPPLASVIGADRFQMGL